MGKSRIEGWDRVRKRVLARLPVELKAEMKVVNNRNADEFMALVERIIPRGDPADGNLANTLRKADAPGSETGVKVSIGSDAQPHARPLEGGHRTASGEHVAGKPFWNPARRVLAKKTKARAARAANKAIKTVIG